MVVFPLAPQVEGKGEDRTEVIEVCEDEVRTISKLVTPHFDYQRSYTYKPIHAPGSVQGFGVLIAVEEDDDSGNLVVRQVSEVIRLLLSS